MGEPNKIDLIDELRWRGLLHQCTDEDGLRVHLAGGLRRVYAGFDPTADSLTIGNLVPIMLLAHVKRAGHAPVALAGGGTGLIGDPSGKSAERLLMTPETVARHVACQGPIFDAVFANVDGPEHTVLNNADWLTKLSFVDALRDIGKHFSVNMMMAKESVRARLEDREHGISYTEFSYMILQAYDFAHLHREGVTVQIGGSDQYGNIVAGVDLIRRMYAAEGEERASPAFGLVAPLVTKADGGKFGKTETGAVWLTADRTSPYAYYQFWLNATDADVGPWLRVFTFLAQDEIEAIEIEHESRPGARLAQRRLAQEATAILYGHDAMERAESAGRALFSGELAGLDLATLDEVFASIPSSDHPRTELEGDGAGLAPLLVSTGAASSNREAREFLANGSVTINGARRASANDCLTPADLLHDSLIAIRRGKKTWRLTRWS